MSAQEREWREGEHAYLEVEITSVRRRNVEAKILNGTGNDGYVFPSIEALRSVSGGGEVEAATERVRKYLEELDDLYGDEDPGDTLDYADGGSASAALLLSDVRLLVGGVPGRSEAEIKAEGYREALEREPAKVVIENPEHVLPFMDRELREAKTEAWERGAYAGREYQKHLHAWARPIGQGAMPVHPPNPYRADQVTDTEGSKP